MSRYIQIYGSGDTAMLTIRESEIRSVKVFAKDTGVICYGADNHLNVTSAEATRVSAHLISLVPSAAAEVDRLRRECEALRLHISLMPGGAAYLAAEADYKQHRAK